MAWVKRVVNRVEKSGLAAVLGAWLLLSSVCCVAAPTLPYQVVSGDLPPFTADTAPDAPGALGEIVKELAARIGSPISIQFFPWARAQMVAQTQARTLILPLTRTPERESQYRWIVRLYAQEYVFITQRNHGIDVSSMESMRSSRIAVLRASPNAEHLRSRDFHHIVEANSVKELVRLLKLDMADAIYGADKITLVALEENGLDAASIVVGPPLAHGEIWLGGSLDISEVEATHWREAMKNLVEDGGYGRILRKYRLPE